MTRDVCPRGHGKCVYWKSIGGYTKSMYACEYLLQTGKLVDKHDPCQSRVKPGKR